MARTAFREVGQLVTIPVYGFWNFYQHHQLFHEALRRTLAPLFIEYAKDRHILPVAKTVVVQEALLRFIAVYVAESGMFHPNYHLLLDALEKEFGVTSKELDDWDALQRLLNQCSPAELELVQGLHRFLIALKGKPDFVDRAILRKWWAPLGLNPLEGIKAVAWHARRGWLTEEDFGRIFLHDSGGESLCPA